MKRKGFTLVELLVVIAIIALLMGILMPALARVRQLAFRMTCGTNLSGIGKAMLLYANDNEDELPKAGGRTNTWISGLQAGWMAPLRNVAYGITNNVGKTTVTSNFYLLVKYAEVTPKQFVCKGESDTREFTLAEVSVTGTTTGQLTLTDAWDFGPGTSGTETHTFCSYSYHHPFANYALTTTHEPTMAVAADRNPWMTVATQRGDAMTFADFLPDEDKIVGTKGSSDQARKGNTDAHQLEGQNVLFLDSHVSLEKRAYCGTEMDNIYTVAIATAAKTTAQYYTGMPFSGIAMKPINRKDSFLVNEGTGITGSTSGGTTGGGR
jgi:prepilin-type N-terminal cleavage/methylation domain-containing protein